LRVVFLLARVLLAERGGFGVGETTVRCVGSEEENLVA